ncbi:hypothetical protein [Superficieibacter sp. HKU1]|uniref:hypothetical protein n=1 Tax=Superficieibacter sp. HKU1 TaxID=3031919 RepID=UPI0023E2DB0A|nr:hypothetical protein [Superficieibacter sp. HKU1]WES69881.1 hypothetical protein P0H77_07880 [Superficieibacter sp. HKU1]
MIIKKNSLIFSLLFLTCSCDEIIRRDEPCFDVYGDYSILKDITINLKVDVNNGGNTSEMKTLLNKGAAYPVCFHLKDVVHYTVYFSYKDKINSLSFDAIIPKLIIKNRNAQVLYVYKEGEAVHMKYYGAWDDIRKEHSIFKDKVAVTREEYLKNHKVDNNTSELDFINNFYGFFG